MIVVNPIILRLDSNEISDSKYYPIMDSDDGINHIRERHYEKNIYLCGKDITYINSSVNKDIIDCPECKIAYRALNM